MSDVMHRRSNAAGPPARAAKSFLTHRPVAVSMVFLAAVVFGLLSYQGLPVTLMPELSYPTLTVRTEYPGAAPEEVENDVSRRIEEQLGVVGGLRRMSSISRAGVSDVVLEFAWDTPMSDAVQETLEKLDLVLLPDSAERPLILRFDPGLDPVLELSLSGEDERFEGEEGLRRLRRLAELQVKRALEPVDGVAAVRVRGGLEEEIHVLLDAQALQRSRLSVQQVIDRLGQENINVAGGTLKEGRTEYMVRTVNEYVNLDQIRATVVASVEGREVRIGDLAEVRRSHRDREILTRTDGAESVQLDVYKEADANMVALAGRVRARVGELDLELERARARGETVERPRNLLQRLTGSGGGSGRRGPSLGGATLSADLYRSEGALLTVVSDRSEFIEGSIAEVRNTAILGGILAVIVLYLFLRNLVTTLFVAVSIRVLPLSSRCWRRWPLRWPSSRCSPAAAAGRCRSAAVRPPGCGATRRGRRFAGMWRRFSTGRDRGIPWSAGPVWRSRSRSSASGCSWAACSSCSPRRFCWCWCRWARPWPKPSARWPRSRARSSRRSATSSGCS